jgi:CheY-like chemotaxis protein
VGVIGFLRAVVARFVSYMTDSFVYLASRCEAVGEPSDMSFRAPVVLIVDDHQDSCAMYAEALGFMGFQPITEPTGECGFARACDIHPDVVVADVILPGISGLELTRRLRNDPRTEDIAIILLTGQSYGADEPQATAAGCDRFLLKPCLPDDLAIEIRHALTRASACGPAIRGLVAGVKCEC